MKLPLACLTLAIAGAAAPTPRTFAATPALVRDLPTPAGPDSQGSNLAAAPDGTLHLTWSGPGPRTGERALYLATLAPGAGAWSASRTIVSSPLLMENWADFASLCVGTDSALTAQWFLNIPGDTRHHGYDGWFSRSTDGGRTWRAPARLGREFVALAPLSAGRTLAVWLENTGSHETRAKHSAQSHDAHASSSGPAMKLLARLLAPDGAGLGEWTLDPDVCTCCQNTVAVLPGDRVFAAYRGHNAAEIRDNKYAVFDGRAWSAPRTLRDDGWKIPACPVNGPAADARGTALAVAWFTAADHQPRVFARIGTGADASLGPPLRLDLGRPLGRIETVALADGSALFLWMEAAHEQNAAGIYARRAFAGGTLSGARLVADSSQARASGFPRAALRSDGRVVMSWTRPGEPSQVLLREIDPAALVATR